MSQESARGDVIVSEFVDDPDMQELVELFRTELPEKIGEIEAGVAGGDRAGLASIAHQMKGACAGYGYPQLGEAAKGLEQVARDEGCDVGAMQSAAEELIDLCRRASFG